MANYLLTKSSFLRGVQCQKSLYLYKNFYTQRDPVSLFQQSIFNRGTNIGILARQLYPGGVDVTPASVFKYEESALLTQKLLGEGHEIIYEATFIFDEILVAVDLLVKAQGKCMALEVKSSASISDTYMMDAALQNYVIKGSGLELDDFLLVYVNREYIKHGELDLNKLFIKTSVKKIIEKKTAYIIEQVKVSKSTLKDKIIPEKNIGEHCYVPYPCDFIGTCWKNIPPDSIFDIGGINKKKQFELYNQGIMMIKDIPDTMNLSDSIKIQAEAINNNKVIIDMKAITDFIHSLHYPLYFLDFESFMPAVPIYDGTHPYEHIPFQYSLHYKSAPDGKLIHKEFLAEAGLDPRRTFAERLLKDTKEPGDILVYNKDFEKKIMNDLSQDFPEYRDELKQRISRIRDLAVPFAKKQYYAPSMKGSYSLKAVLPALIPDLKYDELTIKEGGMASNTFEALQTETDLFKIADTRDALLAYCKTDTLAMVRILELLESLL